MVRRIVAVVLGNGAAAGDQFRPALHISTPRTSNASAFGVADFDGDGNADLVLTSPSGGALRILLGLGSGLFRSAIDFDLGELPPRVPTALAIGDFNGDLIPDLVLAHRTRELSIVLRTPG